MSTIKKITYYDLKAEASAGILRDIVGRSEEIARLTRVLSRGINNNALIVGPDGIGKTALIYGWAQKHIEKSEACIQLDAEHLYALEESDETIYLEAFSHLSSGVVFVDDFGKEVIGNPALMQRIFHVYKTILRKPSIHVVLALEPHEYAWLEREFPGFIRLFETIALKNQKSYEYAHILSRAVPRLNATHRVIVPDAAIEEIVTLVERFPSLGQLPLAGIRLLDETIAFCALKGIKMMESDAIAYVVEAKTGVPKTQLTQSELQSVHALKEKLSERIVHQENAISRIAATLQRAKLGLRNGDRPLGSFLMLGPSGVGKTETAKTVAEIMFGRSESFIRFDMSEFQQDHTVQRLIGAPAGYVGYDEGGGLTNALKKNPHALILLDEIEKAHPKVFDIFLQVLDDGRLTSGQNETVDARNTIIMATSNAAVHEILSAYERGIVFDDTFVRETIVPILAKTFRLEFINRFDNILLFNPLTVPHLMRVAELELKKVGKRLAKHRVQFDIEPHVIEDHIRGLADPRFGARPVKRFIEETCETLLAESLLNPTRV